MDKYNPESIYVNALLRDKSDNEYHEDALYMALILHSAGGERTTEAEREVAHMLDDINE